jgi:hypothetical protein
MNLRRYTVTDTTIFVPSDITISFVQYIEPITIQTFFDNDFNKENGNYNSLSFAIDFLAQRVFESGLPINRIELRTGFQIFADFYRNGKIKHTYQSEIFKIDNLD